MGDLEDFDQLFPPSKTEVQLFSQVTKRLQAEGKLGYDTSVSALTSASKSWSYAETLGFLRSSWEQMVSILTDQSYSKIGLFERTSIEKSLQRSMEILLSMFEVGNFDFMPVLVRMLDKEVPYYAGTKSYYMSYPGDLKLQAILLQRFEAGGGFQLVLQHLQEGNGSWLGAGCFKVLLQGLHDLQTRVDIELSDQFTEHVMQQLLGASDDVLKKENMDVVGAVIARLRRNSLRSMDRFYDFWLRNTTKLLASSSLPVKLFAWEQVNELVREATNTRPPPRRYMVRGAGTPAANGIYEPAFTAGNIPRYTKVCEDPPLTLTLFQCQMRSKVKWWFISEADKDQPGTEKDIDYYQHRSSLEQEKEPPTQGWQTCTNVSSPSQNPPPVLVRLEPMLDDGETTEDLFISKLFAWVNDNNLLGQVFCPSGHREIVARSAKLLSLLAEEQQLTESQLADCWTSACKHSEAEFREEVYTLLVGLSAVLSAEMYTSLMTAVNESMTEHFNVVVSFVEKLSKEGDAYIDRLPAESTTALLQLLWGLYKHPTAPQLKSFDRLTEFISHSLVLEGVNVALVFARELLESLQSMSQLPSPDETQVTRFLFLLQFLLSNHIKEHSSLLGIDVPDVLMQELARFLERTRPQKASEQLIREGLKLRLELLHVFYGTSLALKLSKSDLTRLWDTLSGPVEREQLLNFFTVAGVKGADLSCAFELSECFFAFKTFICSPELDWSQLGEESFRCFRTYYSGLQKTNFPGEEKPPLLGLDRLWDILLSIRVEQAAHDAITLLLRAYDDLSMSNDGQAGLVDMVFERIAGVIASAQDGLLKDEDIIRASRLVAILKQLLDGAVSTPVQAHAAQNLTQRMSVTVNGMYIEQTPGVYPYDNRRQMRSDRSVVLHVHPLQSLAEFKRMIHQALGYGQTLLSVKTGEKSHSVSAEGATLRHLGIKEGTEVTALRLKIDDGFLDFEHLVDESHIASVLSNSAASIDQLFALLDIVGTKNDTLTQAVWELLMRIPTQPQLKAAVHEAVAANKHQSDTWHSLLPSNSAFKAAYVMQILDAALQPLPLAPGMEHLSDSGQFRDDFVASGGLKRFAEIFQAADAEDASTAALFPIALRILKFYMLSEHQSQSANDDEAPLRSLFHAMDASTEAVLSQVLVFTTKAAGSTNATESIEDSLDIIRYLLRDPAMVEVFVSMPSSKRLVTGLFSSPADTIRRQATALTEMLGDTSSAVFDWLVTELLELDSQRHVYVELFQAMDGLLQRQTASDDLQSRLASVVAQKLLNSSELSDPGSRASLVEGCLLLLRTLIAQNPGNLAGTQLGEGFVTKFVQDFLLTIPSLEDKDKQPICNTPGTRHAANLAITEYIRQSPFALRELLDKLKWFSTFAATHLRHEWGLTVSSEAKSTATEYVGLKNQGCTCYMNSLLQQLFMAPKLRELVMSATVPQSARTTIWNVSDAELVGQLAQVEWANGNWHTATIAAFDATLGHTLHYEDIDEVATYHIRHGRDNRETGRVRLVNEDAPALSDSELASAQVLEQVQRTFSFLAASKKRAFDPRPLVEACKCLNLNFNVYHQNDASEFCDQLFDRLETAMKDTPEGKRLMQDCFGGKTVAQKIPTDCDVYQTTRTECGHFASARVEPFMKVELIIRGKETLQESLASYVEGELMDGDNKIMCDTCAQKRTTIRRTVVETLPNLLILHLKRFDLDFQTFEVVKLNNKLEFPMELDMKPYTKDGIEAAERQHAREQRQQQQEDGDSKSSIEVAYEPEEMELDDEDFKYVLQGVLVHAGIAQGGHYYSFARDPDDTERWYRLDDEEVSPFDPAQIPVQCYGGTYNSTHTYHGVTSTVEEDRHANALMLFYQKVRPRKVEDEDVAESNASATETATVPDDQPAEAQTTTLAAPVAAVSGYAAFEHEVFESNLRHVVSKYLLEEEFHAFIRDMLRFATKAVTDRDAGGWSKQGVDVEELRDELLRFAVHFLFDVVLHSRERGRMNEWVDVLKTTFSSSRKSCSWFLLSLTTQRENVHWMRDYLLRATDPLARSTFVQIVAHVVREVAPATSDGLKEFMGLSLQALAGAAILHDNSEAQIALLLCHVLQLLSHAHVYWRTSDDLFTLLRELAVSPTICETLLDHDIVAMLSCFILSYRCPENLKRRFPQLQPKPTTTESTAYVDNASILETIAALVGVPQVKKAALVENNASLWNVELTPEAKVALTEIFNKYAIHGSMDSRTLGSYFDKCSGQANKYSSIQLRNLILRFNVQYDDKLSLEGFLAYYGDSAFGNPKEVWQHLHAEGYGNDLRQSGERAADFVLPKQVLELPPLSSECLLSSVIYTSTALETSEGSVLAIAARTSYKRVEASKQVMQHVMYQMFRVTSDWAWHGVLESFTSLLKCLLSLDDGLEDLRMHELVNGSYGLLVVILQRVQSATRLGMNYQDKQLTQKYTEIAQALYHLPVVRDWFDSQADSDDQDLAWFQRLLAPSQHAVSAQALNERATVEVLNAGVDAVNGLYRFERMLENVPVFSREGLWAGEYKRFSLYKCKMQGDGSRWFISILHDPIQPSRLDHDFYYVESDEVEYSPQPELLPPLHGWIANDSKYGQAPILSLMLDTDIWSEQDEPAFDDFQPIPLDGLEHASSGEYVDDEEDEFGHSV